MDKRKVNFLEEAINLIVVSVLDGSSIDEDIHRLCRFFVYYFNNHDRVSYSSIFREVGSIPHLLERIDYTQLEDSLEYIRDRVFDEIKIRKMLLNDSFIFHDNDSENNYLSKEEVSFRKMMTKIFDHILLSYTQLEKIMNELNLGSQKTFEKHNELIRMIEKTSNDYKIQEEVSKKSFQDLEEKTKSVTLNVITVLGIYSALIFSLMGGFDSFSTAIETISNGGDLGSGLIVGSVLMSSLILLIVLIFELITYISGKKSYFSRTKDEGSTRPRLYLLFVFSFLSTLTVSGLILKENGMPKFIVNEVNLFPYIVLLIPGYVLYKTSVALVYPMVKKTNLK